MVILYSIYLNHISVNKIVIMYNADAAHSSQSHTITNELTNVVQIDGHVLSSSIHQLSSVFVIPSFLHKLLLLPVFYPHDLGQYQ